MSLKSAVLKATGTWRAPRGVTFVWVNGLGAGAGGGYNPGFGDSQDGGGSGEFCLSLPIPVVENTTYTVSIGTGGTPGLSATGTNPGNGSATTFAGFSHLGGFAGDASATRGNGGGPRGGVTPLNFDGQPGTAESPTAFGGASGGVRGGSVGHLGGHFIGTPEGGQICAAGQGAGGCGGGSTLWTQGATGGDAYDGSGPDPDDGPMVNGRDGILGCGGGGAAQDVGSNVNKSDGGAGGNGMVQIFYIAP